MRALLLPLLAALAVAPCAQVSPQPDDRTAVNDNAWTPLPAASFDRAPIRLVYDHVTQQTSLLDSRGETEQVWERADGVPYAQVPTDRPVVVEVRNANALVYTYEMAASVAALRESPPSCGVQARSFATAGGLIVGNAFSPSDSPFSFPSGGSFDDFLDFDLSGAGGLRNDGMIPVTELIQIQRDLAPVVDRLEAVSERLAAAENEARGSLLNAARRGDAQPIGPMLVAIQEQLNAIEPGLGDPAQVPAALDGLRPRGSDRLGELMAAAAAVSAGQAEDSPEAAEVVRLAARVQAAQADAAGTTTEIQRIALRVERALERTTQRVTVRPGDDIRKVSVEVKASTDTLFAAVVPARERTGERAVTAYLGPRAPRGFGCAVAVALTFSPKHASFNVRPDGTLFDDATDGLRSAPAVLFEVAPPVIGSVLGLVGGVGLGEAFAPDLYAGASIRLLRPVLITGGAVWSRVRTLPDGMALGDVIGDDSDFVLERFREDLPREWRPSFFLGLSVVP